jgi:hypothetical protein
MKAKSYFALASGIALMLLTTPVYFYFLGEATLHTLDQGTYVALGIAAFAIPGVVASILTSLAMAIPIGFLLNRHTIMLSLVATLPILFIAVPTLLAGADVFPGKFGPLAMHLLAVGIFVANFVLFAVLGARIRKTWKADEIPTSKPAATS